MGIIRIVLNSPWSLVGLVTALIAYPTKIEIFRNPPALIFYVRSFWFVSWTQSIKGVRGLASGNVVLLGTNILKNDLEHELVHVRQSEQAPFIWPVLYLIETLKHGYRNNKYEKEAYSTTNSVYLGTET